MNKPVSIPRKLYLTTASQSRELDRCTIERFGIDGFTLMEIAASGAATSIQKIQGTGRSGLFICGKGNNAGDALATARHLSDKAGHRITIHLVFGNENLSPDAAKNFRLIQKLKEHGSDIRFIDKLSSSGFSSFDYIVDGIFGTGLNSNVRKPLLQLIEKINSSGLSVYAMDIPSGLHADTGIVQGTAVKAGRTYAFGTNKLGFYLNEAQKYTGEITFIDLPFPSYLRKSEAILIDDDLQKSLPDIKRNAKHKYEQGVVHILAGSEGLTGAAMMAAKSAWKQGAGAVILYAPKKLLPVYEIALPQIIKVCVGAETDSNLKSEHSESILNHLKTRNGVILAGPGMSTHAETGQCLLRILREHSGHAVIDADALFFWELLKTVPKEQKKKWLLTPHQGEAKKYLGASFQQDAERLKWAKTFAKKHGCSLLSKGNPSIFVSESGETYITGYDTKNFSRAGFGDVLSGTIAAKMGITDEGMRSTISALYTGYKKYHQFKCREAFGPEHLA